MITVTIKKTGLLRKAWRMTIQGGNGEKLPHSYNQLSSAIRTANLMFSCEGDYEPVQLRIEYENGTVGVKDLR